MRFLWLLPLLSFFSCSKIELPDSPQNPKSAEIVIRDTLNVAQLLTKGTNEMVAVKGYLVGYCAGTTLSTATNELGVENSNFLLSDKPTLETSEAVTVIGLNKGNSFHDSWNLRAHPEYLGSYVLAYGKLQSYFGVKGIREPKKIEKLNAPPPTHQEEDPIVTNDTLTVSQFLALNINQYAIVKGYIVGTIEGMNLKAAVFGKATVESTNLLIADNPIETDITKVLPIRLKANSAERKELNLYLHPELLGRPIAVEGISATYFTVNGITSLISYKLWNSLSKPSEGDDPTPNPPTPKDTIPISPNKPVPPIISDTSAVIIGRARPMIKEKARPIRRLHNKQYKKGL